MPGAAALPPGSRTGWRNHVHGDLGPGLGEEGGVHGLDVFGGVLGDYPALVVDEIQEVPGEGGLYRGLLRLSQGYILDKGILTYLK